MLHDGPVRRAGELVAADAKELVVLQLTSRASLPSPDDLATVLAVAFATSRVAGLEVTIYNPALDRDGTGGAAFTDVLARGLRRAAS